MTQVQFARMMCSLPKEAPFITSMEIPISLGDRCVRFAEATNNVLIAHAETGGSRDDSPKRNAAVNDMMKVINDEFTPSLDLLLSKETSEVIGHFFNTDRDSGVRPGDLAGTLTDDEIDANFDIIIAVGPIRHLLTHHSLTFNPSDQWTRFTSNYGQLILQA